MLVMSDGYTDIAIHSDDGSVQAADREIMP